jgi:hypothetical protein
MTLKLARLPINAETAAAASIEDLAHRAWEFLTSRGYASRAARRVIQRRLRAAGYRFYIALPDEGPARCGLLFPGETLSPDGLLYVGVTINHCAHMFGDGNASQGWKDFWNWD